MMNKVWLALVFLVIVSGCGVQETISEEVVDQENNDEEREVRETSPDSDMADLEVYRQNDLIIINGQIAKNTPCHELNTTLSRDSDKLILEAEVYLPLEMQDRMCAQVLEFEDVNYEYDSEGIQYFEFVLNEASLYTIEI